MSEWPDITPSRPLWLMTLADLALLLVGFFVLLQASQADPVAVAHSLRQGFAAEPDPPLAIAAEGMSGFAPGSAALPHDPVAIVGWARQMLADPRVTLTVTGAADGSAGDVDPASGSALLLAADRARAVAARIAPLAPGRVAIATSAARARAVTVTLAFSGEPSKPQDPAMIGTTP